MREPWWAMGVGALLAGCEPPAPVQSDSVGLPYLFTLEFTVEQDPGAPDVARTRLYDWVENFDLDNTQGAVELSGQDSLYADDVELDVITRTNTLGVLDIAYSETVPSQPRTHTFELRRGGAERIEADIRNPDPFTVPESIGTADRYSIPVALTLEPPIPDAHIDVTIRAITEDCVYVLGGGDEGAVDNFDELSVPLPYYFDPTDFYVDGRVCDYELILRRTVAEATDARWYRDGRQLPMNQVWGLGVQTVRLPFTVDGS